MSPRDRIARLGELVRWDEWHDSKLPLYLVGMCYAALRRETLGAGALLDLACLLALLCSYACFGHLVNDYSDREADRAAGKRRPLAEWSARSALAVIAAFATATVALAAARFGPGATGLSALALLLAAAYSLAPLRLKERGILGWLAAALAQRTLPLAIVFQALGAWDWAAAALCILATLIGLRFILVHQIRDRRRDRGGGVRTAATARGEEPLMRLLTRGLFPLEIAAACAAIGTMSAAAPALAVLAAGYAAWLWLRSRRGRPLSPVSYDLFDEFYSLLWPLLLALLLAMREPPFIAVAAVVLALQYRRIADLLRKGSLAAGGPSRKLTVALNPADPYPFYALLRAHAAAHPVPLPGLGSPWLVLRYAEALTLFNDARFVKSGKTASDDPRMRALLASALSSRLEGALRGRIEKLATQLLDRARLRGGIDLVADYASVIPLVIIAEMIGVEIENLPRFRAFIHALALAEAGGAAPAGLQAERKQFTDLLRGKLAARRVNPRDDLLSALVTADTADLSLDELLGMTYLLLRAGTVATMNLIGNGVLALLQNPGQLERLRGDAGLIESAVEELLRFDGPLALSSAYTAAVDVEFPGTRIPAHSPVRVALLSVNRDEDQFDHADRLDITRDARHHLAFARGNHDCLGAPLARMEAQIALRILLERSPRLELAVPSDRLAWQGHPAFRGLQRLPLRF